jgi:hypothetical protein
MIVASVPPALGAVLCMVAVGVVLARRTSTDLLGVVVGAVLLGAIAYAVLGVLF